LSLAVVNPVGEDVNVTVADDGSGRYTAGAYTFTAPAYNDITIATTLDPAIQNASGENISVSVTGASSGQTDSTTVVLNDVVPEYTVSSNTPVTEGNDIVLSLAVVNPVGEDVNVTVADDGTGRYTAGAYTFTSPDYLDITIPTSINAGLDNQQIIQVDVTGASSGETDTTNVTLNDLLPTYTLTVRNTSDASITTLVEGGTIRLDLGVTDTVGEDVDWSVSPADARLGATSGTFSSPGYVDIDITTSAPTTFEDNVDLTFTVTGQSSGVQATDTLQLQDGPADITYTLAAPASDVTEGNNWSFTVNSTLANTGTYEDFDWSLTNADFRFGTTSGTITAAQFNAGGGSHTVNITDTSSSNVYQGPVTVTVSGTGATYGNSANDSFNIVDAAGALVSVTGPTSVNDGGTAAALTIDISPSNTGSYYFPASAGTTTGTGSQSYGVYLDTGGGPAFVGLNSTIRFNTDFTISGRGNVTPGAFDNTGYVSNGTWATGVTTEVSSDYYIRATLNSTDSVAGFTTTGTFGSWIQMSSNLVWDLGIVNSSGNDSSQRSIKFEIADDAAGNNILDTFNAYWLGVEVDYSGGF